MHREVTRPAYITRARPHLPGRKAPATYPETLIQNPRGFSIRSTRIKVRVSIGIDCLLRRFNARYTLSYVLGLRSDLRRGTPLTL
jgi:hypothetical protein